MSGYNVWSSAFEDTDTIEVRDACEALVQRMQDLNKEGTRTRSRNLSIAISTMETVVDKLNRVLNGE